ncbi:arylesterase [Parasphingorhabdus marina]|uniref:arylesterase n=1 Tax=Parasphingorhabdus marina TaxID=394732 RepID=UPI001EF4937C|nr:arylesterase [Parasphingorhabdus marina]
MSYGLCIALLQLLIACGAASDDAATSEQSGSVENGTDTAEIVEADLLVVAFGDSLYAGYGLDQNEGFAPELERALQTAGKDVRVHNAGVSGDTTAAGLRRIDFVLDSLPRKPDLFILGLGGNDVLRGLKPSETRANMEAMVKKLKDRDIPIMLTGMLAPPNLGKEFSDEFNIVFPAMAQKYDTALYPFFMDGLVGKADLLLDDGLHPSAAGIDLIVEKITPTVLSALPGDEAAGG